ncbi:gas vesicle protein [Chloroflexota bacterium]
MQPTRDTHATLVDLLDRVLEKGLVLNADLIINVAGIPLLGVNLRAYLAGIETMLKYGIWQDWDEAQRAIVAKERKQKREEEPVNTSGLEPERYLLSSLDSKIEEKYSRKEEVNI